MPGGGIEPGPARYQLSHAAPAINLPCKLERPFLHKLGYLYFICDYDSSQLTDAFTQIKMKKNKQCASIILALAFTVFSADPDPHRNVKDKNFINITEQRG